MCGLMCAHFCNDDGVQQNYQKGDLLVFVKQQVVFYSIERSNSRITFSGGADKISAPIEFGLTDVRLLVNFILSGIQEDVAATYRDDLCVSDQKIVFEIT